MKKICSLLVLGFLATAWADQAQKTPEPTLKDLMPKPDEVIMVDKAKAKIKVPDQRNPLLKGTSCKDKFGTWKPGQPEFEQCKIDYEKATQDSQSRYGSALSKETQDALPEGMKNKNKVEFTMPVTGE